MAAASSMPHGPPIPRDGAANPDRWLFGAAPDLLLGCGLLYVGVFALYCLAGDAVAGYQPTYLLALFTLIFSAPHYGATLIRVYEQRSERRAYALFSLWATLAVGAWFVVSLHDVRVGAMMATVYLTWSPWHYTGQNYGLAVMFLRRRGVPLEDETKKLLYGSFILSYALTFLSLHMGGGRDELYTPAVQRGSEVAFVPIGVPTAVSDLAVPAIALAYGVVSIVALARLLRHASVSDLLPSVLLMASQALWFTVPFAVRFWQVDTGLFPFRSTDFILWVLVAHSVQYIWVTAYFARRSEQWGGFARYLGKIAVAGVAIWTLPVIAFAPDGIGPLSADAGLTLLAASAVNLHHFILDGAIWKLKNSRIAKVLIRAQDDDADEAPRGRFLRPAVWTAAGLAFVVGHAAFWMQIGQSGAWERGDFESISRGLDRLAWVGKDDASVRHALALQMVEAGELDGAVAQLERALRLNPAHLQATTDLGRVLGRLDDDEAAVARFEAVLERREDFAPAHLHLAYQHLRERRIDEAVPHLERAAALAPEGVEARRVLGKVLERQGNFEAAIDHYRRALEIAPDPEGHVLLANALRVTGDDEAAFEHYRLAEQLRRGPP